MSCLADSEHFLHKNSKYLKQVEQNPLKASDPKNNLHPLHLACLF